MNLTIALVNIRIIFHPQLKDGLLSCSCFMWQDKFFFSTKWNGFLYQDLMSTDSLVCRGKDFLTWNFKIFDLFPLFNYVCKYPLFVVSYTKEDSALNLNYTE